MNLNKFEQILRTHKNNKYDNDLLIQKIPGTNISFQCIELEEAEKLYKKKNENISKIIKNIKEIDWYY